MLDCKKGARHEDFVSHSETRVNEASQRVFKVAIS
jgi:hypothetical protein